MAEKRSHDFLMLFMRGDVLVMPIHFFDAMFDHLMDDASAEDFLSMKGFVFDEAATATTDLALFDMPAAVTRPARQ